MACAVRAMLCLSLVQAACAGVLHHLGHDQGNHVVQQEHVLNGKHSFRPARDFKHRLRVCNAYPSKEVLDVYRGKKEKLTDDEPMSYKTCRDFASQLKSGDMISFRTGTDLAGTFSVADLPNNDAVLLLVILRHDTLTNAVAFESHVFANLLNAQVAVIDTYKGSERASPTIKNEGGDEEATEKLRYNSVVAINAGQYRVVLEGFNNTEKVKQELVALERESYIVLRTGVEAQIGESYPEDLMVFPNSDASLLKRSGAVSVRAPVVALLVLIVACVYVF